MTGFLQRVDPKPQPKRLTAVRLTETATPYGQAILERWLPEMSDAPEGLRDATLMKVGRLFGGFIGGGEIPYQLAHDELHDAAVTSGLPEAEVAAKLERHLEFGMREPLSAPNDTGPVHEPRLTGRHAPLRDRLLTPAGMAALPDPEPLIDNVLDQGTTAVLYGKWGTSKSFIALDWACSVATGRPWQGRPVAKARVLYVVGEGAAGFKGRVDAWSRGWHTPLAEDSIAFLPRPVNLTKPREVEELCDLVEEGGFGLVVLDTLARCMVGGDENSASDAGVVLSAMTTIALATPDARGVCLGVHHTGKDGKTLRGSSVFETHPDTVYFTSKDGQAIRLKCQKRKDGPDGDQHELRLSGIEGTSSCIVEKAGESVRAATESMARIQRIFREYFLDTGVSNTELRDLANEHGISRSTFYEIRSELLKSGWMTANKAGHNPFFTRGPNFD